MPDSSVIADVSLTLTELLSSAFKTLVPAPPWPFAELHDLQGHIAQDPARMTIFLFEAVEDPTVRNQQPMRQLLPPFVTQRRPQVPLILRYLLTPWGKDRKTEHLLLGRALQALHDAAILSGPQLRGGLADSSEALKIKLAPLTLEELTRVWYSVHKPYHLSLTYEVRVVRIDSDVVRSNAPVRSETIESATGDGR